tara:strand:+ start:257 stop:538 length:282 start_codon:yes stop_codon:yes gene_type:complete
MIFNGEVGTVSVFTSSNGSLPAGHWAQRATDHIVNVGDSSHPQIAEQATAFKETIYKVIDHYIREAITEDRAKVIDLLRSAGHNDLANSMEKL